MHVREYTGDEHDGGKYDSEIKVRFVKVTGLLLLFLEDSQTVGNKAKAGTDPKEQREETSLLMEEHNVPRGLSFFGKGVISVYFEGFSSLCIRETLFNRGVPLFLKLLEIPHVVFL